MTPPTWMPPPGVEPAHLEPPSDGPWHIHWPHESGLHGSNIYSVCRCGARRTQRALRQYGVGYSPIADGWPFPGEGWLHEVHVRFPGSYRSSTPRLTGPPAPPTGPGGGSRPYPST